jgi:hypothetical protein
MGGQPRTALASSVISSRYSLNPAFVLPDMASHSPNHSCLRSLVSVCRHDRYAHIPPREPPFGSSPLLGGGGNGLRRYGGGREAEDMLETPRPCIHSRPSLADFEEDSQRKSVDT